MKTRYLLPLSLFAALLLNSVAFAEKAPLSAEELKRQADAVVVAAIEDIRVESERSRIERGFGNSDWGIYLTLRLKTVEKGNVSEDQVEARCFRIRSRRSLTEYLTPSGHHPIPGTGSLVRAYLEKEDGSWNVVLPNGITSVDEVNGRPRENLQDAVEVSQLRSRAYTFFFPMELWMLLIFVGLPILLGFTLLVRWFRRRQLQQRMSNLTGQPEAAEP